MEAFSARIVREMRIFVNSAKGIPDGGFLSFPYGYIRIVLTSLISRRCRAITVAADRKFRRKGRMDMKWGFMTPPHLLSLLAAGGVLWGLWYFLWGRSRRMQQTVLGLLSLWGVAAVVYNLVRWGEPLANLPLQLCSVNALLLPAAVVTRNKTLGNLLLLWCLGALAALVLNHEMMGVRLISWEFLFYYVPHIFEFGIPLLLFSLGLVERDLRCIGSTLSITLGVYTGVHICNKLINARYAAMGSGLRVNYMFSIRPNNPLTEVFYRLVPHEYWYMYLVLPIAALYLLAVYRRELAELWSGRRN